MNVRGLTVFVAVLFPVLSSAGIRCDIRTEISSPSYSYSGTLLIERDRSRYDITEGNHPLFNANTSVITRDGGAEIVLLDHARKTWSQRPSERLGGHLSTTRGLNMATTASRPVVRSDRDGDVHRLTLKYSLMMEIEGERIPATVDVEVVSELGTLRQQAFPWGLLFAAKSGFPAVDRQLARRMPSRLPLKQVVTASRKLEGGPEVTESITVSLANVMETDVDDTIFFPPAGYRYEMPVFEFGTER